jgi:hypothetical protein
MPRFYFHLFNAVVAIDEEGRELPDPEAARRAAMEDAREMAAESVRKGTLDLDHYIEVADERGQILSQVRFGDVIRILSLAPNMDQ